jgi:hypothetical protein
VWSQAGVYRLTHPMAERFAALWARADPEHTMMLPVADVIAIVAQLPAKLGSAPEEGKGGGGPAGGNAPASGAPPGPTASAASPGADGAQGLEGGPAGPISAPALIAAERIVHSLPLIPDEQHRLQYHAVLQCLVDHASSAPPLGEAIDLVVTSGYMRSNDKAAPLREVAAARMLQIAWRAHRRRRQRREEALHAAAAAELQAHLVDSDGEDDGSGEEEDGSGEEHGGRAAAPGAFQRSRDEAAPPRAPPPPYFSQRLLTPRLTVPPLRMPSFGTGAAPPPVSPPLPQSGDPVTPPAGGNAAMPRATRPSVLNAITGIEDIPLAPPLPLPLPVPASPNDRHELAGATAGEAAGGAEGGDDLDGGSVSGRGLRTRLPSAARFAPLPSAREVVLAADGTPLADSASPGAAAPGDAVVVVAAAGRVDEPPQAQVRPAEAV